MSFTNALGFLLGYLVGSIPFGLILTRLSGAPDLRSIGSGNIGATNVLRTGNKKLAAATLLGDILKGTAAVFLAYQLIQWIAYMGWDVKFGFASHELSASTAAITGGIGAFIGHLYPVWLRFKGGKGVATYIGILLALCWPVALAFCTIWAVTAYFFRISSLSALVASALAPPLLYAFGVWGYVSGEQNLAAIFLGLTVLLFFKHRDNIGRLLRGEESKIGGST